MSDPDDLSARIDRLEMRLAHQDETIEDLNNTITAQWKQIDLLSRQLAQLKAQIDGAGENAASDTVPERPPPHY